MSDTKLRWQVVEDNAGGLHLAVIEEGRVIYLHSDYAWCEEGLRDDLAALRKGSHPIHDGWGDNYLDPQAAYDELTSEEHGYRIVADQDGIYYDRMGAAALRVFGDGE